MFIVTEYAALNYIGNMKEFALFRFMCLDYNVLYGDGRIIWPLKKNQSHSSCKVIFYMVTRYNLGLVARKT